MDIVTVTMRRPKTAQATNVSAAMPSTMGVKIADTRSATLEGGTAKIRTAFVTCCGAPSGRCPTPEPECMTRSRERFGADLRVGLFLRNGLGLLEICK